MSEITNLKKEIENLKIIVDSYEKILKLNEQEIANADEIIKMYESIIEYSRIELKGFSETAKAHDIASELSREELLVALEKIDFLEKQNKKLREEKNKAKK